MEKLENTWKTLYSGLIKRLFEIFRVKIFVFSHPLNGEVIKISIGELSLSKKSRPLSKQKQNKPTKAN